MSCNPSLPNQVRNDDSQFEAALNSVLPALQPVGFKLDDGQQPHEIPEPDDASDEDEEVVNAVKNWESVTLSPELAGLARNSRRSSGHEQEKWFKRVFVAFRVIQVGHIKLVEQSFTARFDLFVEWQDEPWSQKHFKELEDDTTHWEPNIRFSNADTFITQDKIYVTFPQTGFIGYRVTVEGEFRVHFNLRQFPFDAQKLSIQITLGRERQSNTLLHRDVAQFRDSGNHPNILMEQFSTEYIFRPLRYNIFETSQLTGVEGRSMSQYEIAIPVLRQYGYYLTNAYCVGLVIQLLSLGIFFLEIGDANRIMLTATLFVVMAAFKYQTSNDLPRVAVLTQLDEYLLAAGLYLCLNFVYAGFSVRFASGKQQGGAMEITQETDDAMLLTFCLLCLLMHVLFAVRAYMVLSNRLSQIRTFGELDVEYLDLLKQAGFQVSAGIVRGDVFENQRVRVTERILQERELADADYENKERWSNEEVSANFRPDRKNILTHRTHQTSDSDN